MDLAAKRSALLRNKLVMRFACVLVAVGFLASSVVTPRAQAVAGVDDAVVGSMALASYLSATGLELSVIEGGAATVTSGLGAVAGEYAAATGAAASGEAVLGSIAAGTAISTAGTIVLTAAAVAVCARLAYWLYTTYFSEDDISGAAVNVWSSSFINSNGGYKVAFSTTANSVINKSNYDEYLIPFGTSVTFATGYSIIVYVSDEMYNSTYNKLICEIYEPDGSLYSRKSLSSGYYSAGDVHGWFITAYSRNDYFYIGQVYYNLGGSPEEIICASALAKFLNRSKILGDCVTARLSVIETDNYDIPEIQPTQQMEITIPSVAPGSTLAELVETVPQQVVDGTLTATNEIVVDPDAFGGNSTPDYEDLEDVDELGLPSLGEALTKRFPFSIPWDIARGFMLLAAPPKTPHFEVDFYAPISGRVGGWKGSTKLVLDFSEFEVLGRLSRWTSTIGFCLFLASATKRFIWTA